ncbi:MAG: DNA primase [Candidatus Lokiarchaeota archaeon]|nr:DNA primase [Candidatus Lokiarchaeota archaeon]
MQHKEELTTTKYIIKANIEIEGIVEKPDIVGAIFGQTEGLLGEDLDLRELQKTGRIGRIQVDVTSEGGKTLGNVIIPSSLNKVETSILASALETVDRVGPCLAKIILKRIEDIRNSKRDKIIRRAAEILKTWEEKVTPESQEISQEVLKSVRIEEIAKYGPDQLPAGPGIDESDNIIIVEGRADVLNLLKYGFKNTIAVEGTSIPESIIELCETKNVITFLDGDRGGELILKELSQVADIDYVVSAPSGKEVEALTRKEIIKALRNKLPYEQYVLEKQKEKDKDKPREAKQKKPKKIGRKEVSKSPELVKVPDSLVDGIKEVQETLEGIIFDENFEKIEKIGVQDLADKLTSLEDPIKAIVFDGIISQRLVDIAEEKGVEIIIGVRKTELAKKPLNINIIEFSQVKLEEEKEEES